MYSTSSEEVIFIDPFIPLTTYRHVSNCEGLVSVLAPHGQRQGITQPSICIFCHVCRASIHQPLGKIFVPSRLMPAAVFAPDVELSEAIGWLADLGYLFLSFV